MANRVRLAVMVMARRLASRLNRGGKTPEGLLTEAGKAGGRRAQSNRKARKVLCLLVAHP